MNFDSIMKGFAQAQIAANRRGDFSPDAEIEYLNGVNTALASQLPNPHMAGFSAGREARKAVGEVEAHNED